MKEVIALATQDVRLLLRDTTGFFFTFFFPLISPGNYLGNPGQCRCLWYFDRNRED